MSEPEDHFIPPRAGWVYIAQIQTRNGPTKIGLSYADPFARVLHLERFLPYRLEPVGFIWSENVDALESELHHQFRALWMKGEWFNLGKWELNKIKSRRDFKTPEIAKRLIGFRGGEQIRKAQREESGL